MPLLKITLTLFTALLLTTPSLARSGGGLQWVRLHLLHAAPSEVFNRLGLTHITRHGYTRGLTKGTPDPTFPPGLTDVVPYDAGHALIVRGTVAGVAQFRQRVAAADVPDPRWQVTVTLLRNTGDDYEALSSQDPQAANGQPVMTTFEIGSHVHQYQITVHTNSDGTLAVTCRVALSLTPLPGAPTAILVPTQIWTAPITKDARLGDTLTFDDLAESRAAARQRLGQASEDQADDYQVQVQIQAARPPTLTVPTPVTAPVPPADGTQ